MTLLNSVEVRFYDQYGHVLQVEIYIHEFFTADRNTIKEGARQWANTRSAELNAASFTIGW